MAPKKRSAKASESVQKEKGAPKDSRKSSAKTPDAPAKRSQTKNAPLSRATTAPQTGTRNASKNTSKKSTPQPRKSRPSRAKSPGSYSSAARSAAAAKGWETRRVNDIARQRITIKTNDDEPNAGNYAYKLYDDLHPLHGDEAQRMKWDTLLRPYYGKRLRITINGVAINPDDESKTRTFIRRVGQVNGYTDVFGPGSLYYDAVKAVRNRHSEEEMDVFSVTVEIAGANDKDTESAIRTKERHAKKVARG